MHAHAKSYAVQDLVGLNSCGLCIHVQNTSQMKYSPSERRQSTFHFPWKPLLPFAALALATCWLDTGRGLETALLEMGTTLSKSEMRGAPAELKECATHSFILLTMKTSKNRDKTHKRSENANSKHLDTHVLSTALRLAGFRVHLVNYKHTPLVMCVWGLWMSGALLERRERREGEEGQNEAWINDPQAADSIQIVSLFPRLICAIWLQS